MILLLTGDPEARIAPVMIGDDPAITPHKPYEHIYCRYVSAK